MAKKIKKLNFKGIKLKLFSSILVVVLIMTFGFLFMMDKGMNDVVLANEEKNLRAESNLVSQYIDQQFPGIWNIKDGQLYKDDRIISSNSSLVDTISKKTGTNVTIFLGDTRTATNIYSNGARVIGTKADSKITDVVLKNGKTYTGFYNVYGVRSVVYYTPLKDSANKIIGMLYLGNPSSELEKIIHGSEAVCIILAIVMLLFAFVISYLVSRYFTNNINKILSTIKELRKSHLSVRSKIKNKDEIGDMSRELDEFAEYLENDVLGTMSKISAGDFENIDLHTDDPENELVPVFSEMVEKVKSISKDTQGLIENAKEGNLDIRCDSEKYSGSWQQLASGLNDLMDNIEKPINEVSDVLKSLAVYDFTNKASDEYNGIFSDLCSNVNALASGLTDLQNTIIAVSNGNTSALANFSENDKLSENDNMTPSIILMMQNIDNLIAEVSELAKESAGGNLYNARGDAEKFKGGYREIVKGFNNTLDAISAPLKNIQTVLEMMAKNDLSMQADTNCEGDYLKIVNCVNNVQTQLNSIVSTTVKVAEGDISGLDDIVKVGKQSENDHLIPALIEMMTTIKNLINEVEKVADSEAHGDFTVRGDVDKFSGKYAEIIGGVNRMVDSVEKPTNEITNVLVRMKDGYFDNNIEGNYEGKFAVLVDAINALSKDLHFVIEQLTGIVTRMGDGDFAIDKIDDYRGEFKAISDAINKIIDSLNGLFGNVTEMTDLVSVEASNVSAGSTNLAQTSTEQASTIEEINSTIAEISSMTKKNATEATSADGLVSAVTSNVTDSKKQMDNLVKSITAISESAKNISKINKVISDIAFQTNILAINASVEAAHAGAQGKSFAVVADEIRNLAAKSAKAADDTSKLIETTLHTVSNGTEIANSTSESFNEITEGIKNVSEIMSKIAVNSNQQADSISQIDTGIEQVSKVVQTNSATAEQSAASSKELTSQADKLKKQVSLFKLRDSKKKSNSSFEAVEEEQEETEAEAAPQAVAPQAEPKVEDVEDNSMSDTDFGKY